jgi:predicted PurR-regulated permease PerM
VALVGVGWTVTMQLTSLGEELPRYRDNIRKKVADLRWVGERGALGKLQETVQDAVGEADGNTRSPGPRSRPMPVVVQADRSGQLWTIPAALTPWLSLLATTGLVAALVVFMLVEWPLLRDRFIRIIGSPRLALTTRALDEAGERIGRYLFMQVMVNGAFGLGVGLGLYAIGVPYALIWGLLAGLLRFIPYVGPWAGALPPIALSLAVFPGWGRPLLVVALFALLEVFTGMVLETLLYSSTVGVSQVALLVAVAFWTWLWGPVGLVLATPMTVCLVVAAKYVRDLDFLVVMLCDAPPLTPPAAYYQRLLARDEDEAAAIVERARRERPPETVYDEVFIPALALARQDRAEERLGADEARALIEATRAFVEEVDLDVAEPASRTDGSAALVLGCPAVDEADEVALRMLARLIDPARTALDVVAPGLLAAEVVTRVADRDDRPYTAVCISALPPGGLAQARFLCKRLRARSDRVRIVVGRWGGDDEEAARAALLAAGADAVATTLIEARQFLLQYSAAPAVPQAS